MKVYQSRGGLSATRKKQNSTTLMARDLWDANPQFATLARPIKGSPNRVVKIMNILLVNKSASVSGSLQTKPER